jgi:hypothetical protein
MFTSAIESINGDSRSKIKQDFSPSAMKKRHTPIMLHSAVSGMINRILDVDQYEKTRRLNIYDIEVGENFSESAIDPEIEVLGSISPGISTFAERALTYAAVSKMHVNNPFLVVDRNPIALQKDKIDRVRELGRRQVQLLDSIDPRVTHIYDAKGNLPLVDLTGNELD